MKNEMTILKRNNIHKIKRESVKCNEKYILLYYEKNKSYETAEKEWSNPCLSISKMT